MTPTLVYYLDAAIFKGKTGGRFIDIGAYDGLGEHGSKSEFFEKERGWSGLCVEANPATYQRLLRNRGNGACRCLHAAVVHDQRSTAAYSAVSGGDEGADKLGGVTDLIDEGHFHFIRDCHGSIEEMTVPAVHVSQLTADGAPDLLKIDAECADSAILGAIDWGKVRPHCVVCEARWPKRQVREMWIRGYRLVNQIENDFVFIESRKYTGRVYHYVHGGLGDVLGENFCRKTGDQPQNGPYFSAALKRYKSGELGDLIVVYQCHRPNPAVSELFAGLGVRTAVVPTTENEIPAIDGINLSEWTNSRQLPIDLRERPAAPALQPAIAVPRRFVLLNEGATDDYRRLDDPAIYRAIKDCCHLPIVKVGVGESRIACDQDLTGRLNIREVFWLASRAAAIVSAVTFHRSFASIYGVPVLELSQEGKVTDAGLREVKWDYGVGKYGITPGDQGGLNHWFLWPRDKAKFQSLLRESIQLSS